MKLLWCITASLFVSICNGAIDVEKTVQQVQNILQANVQLPRLSRDEIIQLLNDIRAEDSKSTSASREVPKEFISTTPYTNYKENEINHNDDYQTDNNNVFRENDLQTTRVPPTIETSTKSAEPTVMVVLPYTPRDGSSLQELYTKPPRVEVVPASQVASNADKIQNTLKSNAEIAKNNRQELPDELESFLNTHGMKMKSGQDHFLLPLEGFKPLPPAKVIDGTVQLPENILLTYDLVSPDLSKPDNNEYGKKVGPIDFLFNPLKPQYPFELETSASESKETSLPFDLPKNRENLVSTTQKPNYEPIDYDSVKVIPLNKNGPSPFEDDKAILESEQSKRQTNSTTETSDDSKGDSSENTEDKNASGSADTGASIADLEDSFGGAAPVEPGDSMLPPPKKNGFYWMLDWNSFLEVGDGDTKVNIRLEPKLGDPQMFIPVNVP